MTKSLKAFGTWSSPISARSLAESLRLNDVQWDGDTLVWHEGRGARGVLVAQQGGQAPRDLTGDLSARAGVGYGGGDYTVGKGHVYFVSAGRLYKQSITPGSAQPLTPAFGDAASPRLSPDGHWLLYVHSYEGSDSLALADTSGEHWPRQFAGGTDFVMQPAWHPAGDFAAYIAWNHPNMPWDGTELRLAVLEYDRAGVPYAAETQTLAGDTDTAIFQPEFSPDGRWLAYVSDATGWNQLYLYDIAHQSHKQITQVDADHARPAWIQGLRVYAWSPDSKSIIYTLNEQGFNTLWQLDIETGKSKSIPGLESYSEINQIAVAADGRLAFIGSGLKIPPRVVTIPSEAPRIPPPVLSLSDTAPTVKVIVNDSAGEQVHRRSSGENVPPEELAEAQAISWKGHDGETAYGLYYAPASSRYEGTESPPLIISVHGGPTSQVTAGYNPVAQFFTTRGYAVFFPNHRGSTGYGRTYMNKLRGNWGLYDVEDSASGAAHLASLGLADPRKLVIMGGSAGGFTVLQSLVDKPGFYRAGVCLFGVSNQFTLVADTHKFEAHYSDLLLGVLPQAADNYRLRSPIFHAQKIVDPVIVFQGEDDKVVPKAQSEAIVASLRARHIPHEYHLYPGEGHGWRKPETIEHYYTTLIAFLKQYVIFA